MLTQSLSELSVKIELNHALLPNGYKAYTLDVLQEAQ